MEFVTKDFRTAAGFSVVTPSACQLLFLHVLTPHFRLCRGVCTALFCLHTPPSHPSPACLPAFPSLFQVLFAILIKLSGTAASGRDEDAQLQAFLESQPDVTSFGFLSWLAGLEAAAGPGPQKQQLDRLLQFLVEWRETQEASRLDQMYFESLMALSGVLQVVGFVVDHMCGLNIMCPCGLTIISMMPSCGSSTSSGLTPCKILTNHTHRCLGTGAE